MTFESQDEILKGAGTSQGAFSCFLGDVDGQVRSWMDELRGKSEFLECEAVSGFLKARSGSMRASLGRQVDPSVLRSRSDLTFVY